MPLGGGRTAGLSWTNPTGGGLFPAPVAMIRGKFQDVKII